MPNSFGYPAPPPPAPPPLALQRQSATSGSHSSLSENEKTSTATIGTARRASLDSKPISDIIEPAMLSKILLGANNANTNSSSTRSAAAVAAAIIQRPASEGDATLSKVDASLAELNRAASQMKNHLQQANNGKKKYHEKNVEILNSLCFSFFSFRNYHNLEKLTQQVLESDANVFLMALHQVLATSPDIAAASDIHTMASQLMKLVTTSAASSSSSSSG